MVELTDVYWWQDGKVYEGISDGYTSITVNEQPFLKIEGPNKFSVFYKVEEEKCFTGSSLCSEVKLTNSINLDDNFKSLRIFNGREYGGEFDSKFGEHSGIAHARWDDMEWNILYAKHSGEYITAQASKNKNIYAAFYDEVKEKGVKISELPEKLREKLMEELPLVRVQYAQERLDAKKDEKTDINQTTEQEIAAYEKSRENRAPTILDEVVEAKLKSKQAVK